MRAALLAVLLAWSVPAAAQTSGWGKTDSGCQVWNPWEAGGTLGWTGGCTGGKASGKGTLLRGSGAQGRVFDGTLREGKAEGQGKIAWADGSSYEGFWRGGQRSGRGVQLFRQRQPP